MDTPQKINIHTLSTFDGQQFLRVFGNLNPIDSLALSKYKFGLVTFLATKKYSGCGVNLRSFFNG
ncbi:MAG: hypothetical protein EAZ77_12110 [Nostocales cyanobacterium]|nr:MAG: hypothetical protein EAZ77_12110 [Nostocales cyanobacterium]